MCDFLHALFDRDIDWSLVITVFGTLVAAFAGSYSAFKLNEIKSKKDMQQAEVAAANVALVQLSRMVNTMEFYRRGTLTKFRDEKLRPYVTPCNTLPLRDGDLLKIELLSFLIKYDGAALLGKIDLENQRYASAVDMVNIRCKYHQEEIQPVMGQFMGQFGAKVDIPKFEAALGLQKKMTIKHMTDEMYDQVEKNCQSIKESLDLLFAKMKAVYPKEIFIKLELLPEEETAKLFQK